MTKRGNNMIKVDNLSYSFPQKDLYNNISFTIEEGQHCAFIGASGSGKSTLIDIIMDPERYLFDGTFLIILQYLKTFPFVNRCVLFLLLV